jgi:hypothetical protein
MDAWLVILPVCWTGMLKHSCALCHLSFCRDFFRVLLSNSSHFLEDFLESQGNRCDQ